MDRQAWERVRALFERALEWPADARARFLDEACADDATLRREVEAMLRADADAAATGLAAATPEFAEALAGTREREGDAWIGRRVGVWRLLRELGRGGMGTVYLAERDDGEYVQQAAVKLMRGGWSGEALLQRFRAERQILATLGHPNIARLLDGGVDDDGRPFLALEYVDGSTLAEHCDARRLGIGERLALFLAVCDAVAYAHRSLVVHRDLKPSNILVDAQGHVKLLDFGIARLLDAGDAAATATALRMFTPEYAAPEQIQGKPVTTGVDVHALGLLLYELLTGRRPYDATGSSPAAYEQAILTAEPLRPSRAVTQADARSAALAHVRSLQPASLRARLRGDLDAIVLKALRKEPEQRYASVEAMAEDVRAYLAHAPVKARRGNVSYRLARFLRRHALAAGLAAVALSSLVAGLGTAVWQARVAREQRDVARVEARNSAAVVDFLTGVFAGADPANTDGRDPAASELLANGVAGIDAQTDLDPATRSALLGAMARAHSGLGDGQRVQDLMQRSLAEAERSGDARALVRAHMGLAYAYSNNSRYQDTLEHYGIARRLIAERGIDDPLMLAHVDASTGNALNNLDRDREAWDYLERAYAVRLQREGAVSEDVAQMLPVSVVVLKGLGRGADAVSLAETSYRATNGADIPLARRALIAHAYSLALGNAKRYAEAEQLCREALDLAERVYGKGDPRTVPAQISWGVSLRNLERFADSAAVMDQVLAIERRHLAPDHRRIADILVNVGASHTLAGDGKGAVGYLEESLAISQRRNEMSGRTAARATAALARALEESGDGARALDVATKALAYTDGAKARLSGAPGAAVRVQYARLLQRFGRMPADCAPAQAALSAEGAAPGVHVEATILAATCAMENGRAEEAARLAAALPAEAAAPKDLSGYARDALQRLRAR
ncbi:serine/threonine-protein kinase [Dokdonella fugitiva]|uniref:Serine/threonine-protein kinase n=1 Tax=Dokdonella fugitiva TaxID=328517 RepID=A0A839F0X9_9GAMM|nr:serine/threonine-protein kinase [Dokdonella fugitiva]MBA8888593.1 serine/threonine-protein kinase [Dokdonella fugitiva]